MRRRQKSGRGGAYRGELEERVVKRARRFVKNVGGVRNERERL